MIYAIVRKVVTPAITSVLKLVLCFLYSKYFFIIEKPFVNAEYPDSMKKSF